MLALELAVVPLDVARRTTMRLATRSAFVTRILARRDSRIACLATLQIALLFALTLRAPVALFFVGPILFGVAHLAADVRYLVLHRAPPRGLVIASAGFALAITAVEVGARLRVVPIRSVATIEVALGVAWVGLALAVALRGRALAWRGIVVAPLFLAAAWFLVGHARAVGLVLIHAHNAIAVLAWLVLFRRRVRWAVVPVALMAAGTAVLVSGAYLPWTFARGGGIAFGTQLASLGSWLAPGARPALGIALASSFVFLQGVHYAAWTGWIPQDDLATEGTPTFRMSVRALGKDFGPIALAVIALAALGFAGVALWSVQDSVGWYMMLAKSHAWFECAFFGYFLLRGERRRTMTA